MANDLRSTRTNAVEGLGTHTLVVGIAGPYKINCYSTMKIPSGITITITQNSTTLITAQTPVAPQQDFLFVETFAQAVVGDTLNVVIASSNLNDVAPNYIKSIIKAERLR